MTGSKHHRRRLAGLRVGLGAIGLRAVVLVALALCGCEIVTKLAVQDEGLPCEVQRVFEESCALSACHDGTFPPDLRPGAAAGSVDSTSVAGIPYVDIGNLAGSYMAVKIMEEPPEGAPARAGVLMPSPPGMITDADRALLVGWMSGADLEICGGGGSGGSGGSDVAGDDGMPSSGDPTAADGTTAAPEAVACGIDDVDNGGMIATIDAGDGVGQIPTEIGDILAGNCGCHYSSMIMTPPFASYPPTFLLDMTTLDAFSQEIDADGTIASVDVRERLLGENGVPIMPSPPCSTAEGEAMDPALRDTLIAWIDAGLPDGATWTGG